MDDVEHISHCLCRVIDIALQVDKSRFLLKDTVFISLCYGVNNFVHISISFADVHIIADADNVSHERDHVGCLADCLTVCNLRFSLVQILNLKT